MRTDAELEDSNLVAHARQELELTGWFDEDGDDVEFAESLINAVREFARYGHSGGSASAATYMLHDLLQFKPLSAITSNPQEWMSVHEAMGGMACWQCTRQSSLFSYDAGRTWYNIDDPRWSNRWSPTAWLYRRKWNKVRAAADERKFVG